eukprot:00244_2
MPVFSASNLVRVHIVIRPHRRCLRTGKNCYVNVTLTCHDAQIQGYWRVHLGLAGSVSKRGRSRRVAEGNRNTRQG